MKTKKIGSAGRFGARYGLKIRRRVVDIEKLERAKQNCPVCKTGKVKRMAMGIYVCRKCKAKIAGKAYTLE